MSIHFYTRIKDWRRARAAHKQPDALPQLAAKPVVDPRIEASNAAVYAAGIACAGQVGERVR